MTGQQIEQVRAGGPATWHENQLVPILRDAKLDDVYWTYSYSPIDDPEAPNEVGGVLVIAMETTATVLAEKRQAAEAERQRSDRVPGRGVATALLGSVGCPVRLPGAAS